MKRIFPKIIDIICFIGGSSLFTYTLFDFNSTRGDNEFTTPIYYYTDIQTIILTIGIGLIALGFLIRSWKKGK